MQARLTAELDAGERDEYLTATIHEILRLRLVLPNAEPRLTKQRRPGGAASRSALSATRQ